MQTDFFMDHLLVQFSITNEKIVHETVAQETLVIDLGTGTYYSFNETASYIWQELVSGQTLQTIIETLSASFPDQTSGIRADLHSFTTSLTEAGLLCECSESIPKKDIEPLSIDSYRSPTYEVHTDMEALLLADPIHEFQDS